MALIRLTFLSALLVCVSVSAHAEEPISTCEDGFVTSDATSGHCCWPGQVWSDDQERCTGTPQCPGGWVANGSICARVGASTAEKRAPTTEPIATQPKVSAVPPAPKPVVEEKVKAPTITAPRRKAPLSEADAALVSRPPSTERRLADEEIERPPLRPGVEWDDDGFYPYDGGPIPPGYRLDWRARRWLTTPGFIVAGVGHAVSALQATFSGCSKNVYSLIPLAGAVATAAACGTYSEVGSREGKTFTLLVTSTQMIGIGMIVLAYVMPQQILVPDTSSTPRVSWMLMPGTDSTAQGLTLGARF